MEHLQTTAVDATFNESVSSIESALIFHKKHTQINPIYHVPFIRGIVILHAGLAVLELV